MTVFKDGMGKTTRRTGRFSTAVPANKKTLCARGASDGGLDKNVQERHNWKKDNVCVWGEGGGQNMENGKSSLCEFQIKPVYLTSRDHTKTKYVTSLAIQVC